MTNSRAGRWVRSMLNRNPVVMRWSDTPDGMSIEECARKGVEAVGAMLINEDSFGTRRMPTGYSFQVCAEMYYSDGDGGGDFIGAYFRPVQLDEDENMAVVPKLGRELTKMILQPLSDGSCLARWGPIDRSRASESDHNVGMIDPNNMKEAGSRPFPVGPIPAQPDGDSNVPSFLFLKLPNESTEGKWIIQRRFGPYQMIDGTRQEDYVTVYPAYEPENIRGYRINLDGTKVEVQAIIGITGLRARL